MIDFTTTFVSSGTSYSVDDDLNNRFGRDNVNKWADLNNNDDAGEILARRQWAREQAHAYINARLKHGPYAIPFEQPADPVITRMEAGWAGVVLYESRGVADYDADGESADQLQHVRKEVSRDIRDILTRRLRLDLAEAAVTHPQVIEDDGTTALEERLG